MESQSVLLAFCEKISNAVLWCFDAINLITNSRVVGETVTARTRTVWGALVREPSGITIIKCGFMCAFSCMFQYSLCHGMNIGTCDIEHWSAAPHNRIANRTGFSVYAVLVLNVIRYSCHYFLDRILFHHDFHHDNCDYHWDFYGH